jgi:DNA-binding transcriptional ArsR family regulator
MPHQPPPDHREPAEDLSVPEEVACALCACGGIEGLTAQIPADEELERLGAECQACADTCRLKILFMLRDQPLCVCVIKYVLGIADSKLSYHLSVLRKAGMITGEQVGNWIIYSITATGKTFLER